jgi:biotin transport system permease protein
VRNTNLGLYQPGNSWLHRLPAGVKLFAMLVFGVLSVFAAKSYYSAAAYALIVFLLFLSAGFGPKQMWTQLRPVLVILIFTSAMHLLTRIWLNAIAIPVVIGSMVLVAALMTLTTPMQDLIDVIVKVAGPLRHFGVDPDRLGIAMLLGIRCVPLVAGIVSEVRQAQIARTGMFQLSAFAVPLVVNAIRQADSLGEALVARGVDD